MIVKLVMATGRIIIAFGVKRMTSSSHMSLTYYEITSKVNYEQDQNRRNVQISGIFSKKSVYGPHNTTSSNLYVKLPHCRP
jgi:hypothetical protein